MANITESKPLYKNWRMALAIGLSIGLGIKATGIVEHILEPRFGAWGTVLTGLVAIATVAGLVYSVRYSTFPPPREARSVHPEISR